VSAHIHTNRPNAPHHVDGYDVSVGDARLLADIGTESVHLIVTSPPYWTLKRYGDTPGQLGNIADYRVFLRELDRVWRECLRVLVPGGRLVCIVGDILLARRRNGGRHRVLPLHADIAVSCNDLGFDYLTPILWQKIANAKHEVENGSAFLGKPYEPNGIVKAEIEYLLMLRKPGAHRRPTPEQRERSRLTPEEHRRWFRPVWTDISGVPSREHPAPFPLELASRLVRMFSFWGDTVLDPLMGSGTSMLATVLAGRRAVGRELEPAYVELTRTRLARQLAAHRRRL
jgi:modification methylase